MSSTYCVRADIENTFGTTNVNQWGDLENTAVAATITARITWAIGCAGDDIDSVLMTHALTIPVQDQDGDVPTFLRDLAAIIAGVKLYESRGVEDVDREGNPQHRLTYLRSWAYGVLEQIRRGERAIPGAV